MVRARADKQADIMEQRRNLEVEPVSFVQAVLRRQLVKQQFAELADPLGMRFIVLILPAQAVRGGENLIRQLFPAFPFLFGRQILKDSSSNVRPGDNHLLGSSLFEKLQRRQQCWGKSFRIEVRERIFLYERLDGQRQNGIHELREGFA